MPLQGTLGATTIGESESKQSKGGEEGGDEGHLYCKLKPERLKRRIGLGREQGQKGTYAVAANGGYGLVPCAIG